MALSQHYFRLQSYGDFRGCVADITVDGVRYPLLTNNASSRRQLDSGWYELFGPKLLLSQATVQFVICYCILIKVLDEYNRQQSFNSRHNFSSNCVLN